MKSNKGTDYDEIATRNQLKRARITAIILGIASLVCILLFVFAQIQSIEAERNYELVIQLKKELEMQKMVAEENRLTAVRNEQMAKANELSALKALEECRKKK